MAAIHFRGACGTRWLDFNLVRFLSHRKSHHVTRTSTLALHCLLVPLAMTGVVGMTGPVPELAGFVVALLTLHAVLIDWLSGALLFGAYWQCWQVAARLSADRSAVWAAGVSGLAVVAVALLMWAGHVVCEGRAPRLHGFTPRARAADGVYELVLGAPLALVLRFVLAIGYTPRLHRINDSVGVRKDL